MNKQQLGKFLKSVAGIFHGKFGDQDNPVHSKVLKPVVSGLVAVVAMLLANYGGIQLDGNFQASLVLIIMGLVGYFTKETRANTSKIIQVQTQEAIKKAGEEVYGRGSQMATRRRNQGNS